MAQLFYSDSKAQTDNLRTFPNELHQYLNRKIIFSPTLPHPQVLVIARSCGFKSRHPHHEKLDFIGLFSFAPVKINGQTRWL